MKEKFLKNTEKVIKNIIMLLKPSVIQGKHILMSLNVISSRAGYKVAWIVRQPRKWGEMYAFFCHRVNVN